MEERRVSKADIVVYVKALIIILLIFAVIGIVWNAAYYPLSRRAVHTYMEDHSVLNFKEIAGTLVVVSEAEQGNHVRVFVPSIVLNRYRLQIDREYTDSFLTAVPGKFRYFPLDIHQIDIDYTLHGSTRIRVSHVIGILAGSLSIANLVMATRKRRLEKRASVGV